MNITRLAEQLKTTPRELLEILPRLGFHVGARAQKINDSQVDKVVNAYRRHKKLEELKNRESEILEIREKKSGTQTARAVALPETIIVKDLAELLRLPIAKVMAEMMRNGIMASLNERLDFETASIISEDLGYTVTKKQDEDAASADQSKQELLRSLLSDRTHITKRPPVVVVMGHVDHGKTKLLDAIRKTNIVAGESGGITQHIGAYQTEIAHKDDTRTITFLDTPGHEAFKAMRSRGGQIADVAILVVAADDGLRPQTLESIAIIQKESLPMIVAINKIDKPAADIEKVKKELAEINLAPEDWGGKTVCAPIAAINGTGLPELLELVALTADLEDLKADPDGNAVGTIIESHIDKGEGPVATVLVQAGTLKINDLLVVGPVTGKVKALKNWKGSDVREATPGTPVKILGLKGLPDVGEILLVEKDKREYARLTKNFEKRPVKKTAAALQQQTDEARALPSLNLIVRADVMGSLEALEESLMKLNSDEAQVRVIKRGLGFPTEADILTAQATNAAIISFHLKENKKITALAEERKVSILYYDVIYHAIEKIKAELESIKKPTRVRELTGALQILAIFKTLPKSVICGGKILRGMVKTAYKVKVLRGESVITYGDVLNVQSGRQNVTEAVAPNEVGLELACEPVIQVGDVLEFFVER